MSLDIWLSYPAHEWRDDVPRGDETWCVRCDTEKKCGECGQVKNGRCTVADQNITHNVRSMWSLVGVYDALYMSDGKKAAEALPALRAGLLTMQSEGGFAECEKLNPDNGWGDARAARDWLARWLAACEANPDAEIGVCK